MAFSLDGLRMNAAETSPNGVIGKDTIFTFSHQNGIVSAEYVGGKIVRGYLVGKLEDDSLVFRYAQISEDRTLDGGVSHCEITKGEDGRFEIIERFEWASKKVAA